ncbi:hypothetical protein BOX15_Mlig033367g1, partial [Macrostomum lignano]
GHLRSLCISKYFGSSHHSVVTRVVTNIIGMKTFLFFCLLSVLLGSARSVLNYTNATLPTVTSTKEVDMETSGGKLNIVTRTFNSSVNKDYPFISCSFESATPTVNVHWSWANGTQFTVDQDFGTQSTTNTGGDQHVSKFSFPKFAEKGASIVGKYKCVIERNTTFYPSVFTAPIVKMSDKDYRSSMEGDVMTQSCTIAAYPDAVVTWSKDNETVSADGTRIVLSNNNSTLTINELKKTDAGLYVCTAENQFGIGQAYIKLRVKDRLAALWPFLGILAEVVILVTIILLYERKRSNQKRSQEEQDTAEVNKEEPNAKDDSDVRHRPVKT